MTTGYDPFAILELPKTYTIDRELLRSNYIRLSRKWHPDRFVSEAPEDQESAEQKTSELNAALSLLSDDWLRASSLLAHLAETSIPPVGAPDQKFLQETMMLRFQAEEARENKDTQAFKALKATIDQRMQSFKADVSLLFEHRPLPIEKIQNNLVQWKTMKSLLRDLE